MKTKKTLSYPLRFTLVNGILCLFSLSCLFPVIWMIYSSFKTSAEFSQNILSLPQRLNLEHYRFLLTYDNLRYFFLNSTRNTVCSIVCIILFSFLLGYFLARFRFRGATLLNLLFVVGMLVPVHALLVPMYIQFKQFGLSNRWFTIILTNVAFGLPTAMFLVKSYIAGIPTEMEYAAAIDGAGFSRTMFGIIMPMTRPILTTVGIINFFSCWNEFIFSLILINDVKLYPLSVGINLLKGEWTVDYTRIMTLMTVAIAPAMLLYFCFSRYIIDGMVAGAVKG